MVVTLKDGSKKEYSEPKSVIEIASDISEGLARVACAGELDGEVVDLRTVIDKDCELSILTFEDESCISSYSIPYPGSGTEKTVSGCEAGDRTFYCRGILL